MNSGVVSRRRWSYRLKSILANNFNNYLISIFILTALTLSVNAISYRCENNQILIVQNFGNDTIRMHCQKLHLCGNEKLVKFFVLLKLCSNFGNKFFNCFFKKLTLLVFLI